MPVVCMQVSFRSCGQFACFPLKPQVDLSKVLSKPLAAGGGPLAEVPPAIANALTSFCSSVRRRLPAAICLAA